MIKRQIVATVCNYTETECKCKWMTIFYLFIYLYKFNQMKFLEMCSAEKVFTNTIEQKINSEKQKVNIIQDTSTQRIMIITRHIFKYKPLIYLIGRGATIFKNTISTTLYFFNDFSATVKLINYTLLLIDLFKIFTTWNNIYQASKPYKCSLCN